MSALAQKLDIAQLALPRRSKMRRLAIWGSLGLVCLAAMASLMLMQGFDRQLQDFTETYAVRHTAQELTHSLAQAEASQRGFLLTGDNQFLETYEQSLMAIDVGIGSLVAMTADDVQQNDRVKNIANDISARRAEMARAVELVMARRSDEAQSLTQTGMGARLMAEVSKALEDFIAEEDNKLLVRSEAIDQTRLGLAVALLAALAAAVILAYALLYRTQRQVSALAQRQEGLVTLNEALEAQIADRTREIEQARAHAERERQRVETLLQDTNHRIGNSLATVSSLLALQMLRTSSMEVRNALEAARLRVHAIASAHRRLRLGDDLENANAAEFLTAVIEDIATTQVADGRIKVVGEIDAIDVKSRDATTLGILVGELVTNAIKHAFPDDRSGVIKVRLHRDEGGIPTLTVSDDGIGMNVEADEENGLGSVIVRQLAGQFEGETKYAAGTKGGLEVTVTMPALRYPNEIGEEH